MSTPHIILWCATSLGLLLMLRNPTGGALALGWIGNEIYWMSAGSNVSIIISLCADIFVLGVIFAKATIREGCRTYPTLRLQLYCAWRAITLWDKLVASGYIFTWWVYAANFHPYYTYWYLFYIFLAQLFFADCEVFQWLLGKLKGRVEPNRSSDGLAFAGIRRYG